MAPYTPKYSRNTSRKKGVIGVCLQWLSRAWKKALSVFAGTSPVGGAGRPHVDGRRLSRIYVLFAVVPMFMLLGGWFCYGWLASSDIFRLTELIVTGNRMVSRQQLIEKSGLQQGMNLLGFDVAGARSRMQDFAWVDRVNIHVDWPSRVEITVREHHPLALAHLGTGKGGQLFYLDEKGHIFAPVLPGQDVDFPILTGELRTLGLEDKQILPDTPAAAALSFLRLAARGNAILPAQAVSEVHVDGIRGLTVYLVDRPFPIYMGKERIRTRYYRLVKILERLYRKKKIAGIKEIRMNYTENRVLVATVDPGR